MALSTKTRTSYSQTTTPSIWSPDLTITDMLPVVESALCIVNQPSGSGRTQADIKYLQQLFNEKFETVPRRIFTVTNTHEIVVQRTRQFLASHPGPYLLLSGGGGGTNRAVVQGLLEMVEAGSVDLNQVRVSTLRLGSGNLLPRQFDLPKNPEAALQAIADDMLNNRQILGTVYKCTCYYPDLSTQHFHGLTMGGLGQFARVPNDISHWRERHSQLMKKTVGHISIEHINTFQYIAFSIARALRCLRYPSIAERVEVSHRRRSRQFRLFSGLLINFDFPQLPFQTGCTVSEPRLTLCLIPLQGRRQTISALLSWPNLNDHIYRYEITPDQPLEISFLDRSETTLAIDEDTFVVPNRIKFEVATQINLVTGSTAMDIEHS
ncbi:MAG: diacylglycerol kinase family protein [Chloroflexota bacterium]